MCRNFGSSLIEGGGARCMFLKSLGAGHGAELVAALRCQSVSNQQRSQDEASLHYFP